MHNNLLKGRGMRDFSKEKILDKFSVDIELTNACNASCSFCPRDKMPDIGTIKPYHFYKAVERGLEHPGTPYFAFCGTGDSLMNKSIVKYAQYIRDAGGNLSIATNGHLMNEEKAQALIEAGVSQVTFNVASRGEKYEQEYGLDFKTTYENILNFIKFSKGRCTTRIALVLHDDGTRYEDEEMYWRSKGVKDFINYEVINRAGALYPLRDISAQKVLQVKQSLRKKGEIDACLVPFFFFFIGWDGYYYLCSSDWQKKVRVGHIETHAIEETYAARKRAVKTRSPICAQCTSDPVNRFLSNTLHWKEAQVEKERM